MFSSYFSTPRRILIATAAASALMLAAALVAQYGFGLYPCELCLIQRMPYALIIVAGLFGAYLVKSARTRNYLILLVALFFAVDASIAFYHTGVEAGWFPAPDACASDGGAGQTLEEMRAAIMNAPLVACDQAMAHILGLSLAAWNAIAASILALLTLLAWRRL